jgi:hypothetical protein
LRVPTFVQTLFEYCNNHELRSCQTKEYKIGICCFSAKNAALRRKRKDWLARNQENVSDWSDMSTHGLFFQWASTIKIQLSVLIGHRIRTYMLQLMAFSMGGGPIIRRSKSPNKWVIEWLLHNANSAIFQPYPGENKFFSMK